MNSISRECRKCGYGLRGLEPNPDCPECGTLNLFVKPYRGVEIFAFTAKSGLRMMLWYIMIFAVGCAGLALAVYSGEPPSSQLPDSRWGMAENIFVLAFAVVLLCSYIYTRFLSQDSLLRLDWDENLIEAESCVHRRAGLPFRMRYASYPMSSLQSYGYGSPLGRAVYIAKELSSRRHRENTSWLYLQIGNLRLYIHEQTEDRNLLEYRLKESQLGVEASTLRESMKNKRLPGWATVLAFIFLLLSVLAIWFWANELFFEPV